MSAQRVSMSILPTLVLFLAPPLAHAERITIPTGTRLTVSLDHDLRSDSVLEGDRFESTVLEPVRVDGRVAVPAGSSLEGRITIVKSLSRSGVIGIRFVRLRTSDGRIHDVEGVLAPTREGEVVPISSGKKTAVVLIGGESDTSDTLGKKVSTLVGNDNEDVDQTAERWAHSGLSPRLAEATAGTELVVELRRPLSIEAMPAP